MRETPAQVLERAISTHPGSAHLSPAGDLAADILERLRHAGWEIIDRTALQHHSFVAAAGFVATLCAGCGLSLHHPIHGLGHRRMSWAVSHGAYSYYGIDCICPDQATAEAVAAKLNSPHPGASYDQHYIEEFPEVTSVEQVRTHIDYSAQITIYGRQTPRRADEFTHAVVYFTFNGDEPRQPEAHSRTTDHLTDDGGRLTIIATGPDLGTCWKIARERYAIWAADRPDAPALTSETS